MGWEVLLRLTMLMEMGRSGRVRGRGRDGKVLMDVDLVRRRLLRLLLLLLRVGRRRESRRMRARVWGILRGIRGGLMREGRTLLRVRLRVPGIGLAKERRRGKGRRGECRVLWLRLAERVGSGSGSVCGVRLLLIVRHRLVRMLLMHPTRLSKR